VGGSWRTRREPTLPGGEHANSTQKDRPDWELNPRPSCCEATVLATTPPCSPALPICICFCINEDNNVLVVMRILYLFCIESLEGLLKLIGWPHQKKINHPPLPRGLFTKKSASSAPRCSRRRCSETRAPK